MGKPKVRTFDELTTEERNQAVEQATREFLEYIAEGYYPQDDEGNPAGEDENLNKAIKSAYEAMERNQTPWFFAEALMDRARGTIEEKGLEVARKTFYLPADDEKDLPIRVRQL